MSAYFNEEILCKNIIYIFNKSLGENYCTFRENYGDINFTSIFEKMCSNFRDV